MVSLGSWTILCGSDYAHQQRINMKTIIKRLLPYLITTAALAFLASSCNTIRGAGRDVEQTGNNIQKATN
jgi:predicted small secreted protein